MKEIEILRKALQEPRVEGLKLISYGHIDDIVGILSENPDAEYVSEWKYELAGPIRYEYRLHNVSEGRELKELYQRGKTSSLPRLTGVYTRQELISMKAA